MDLFLPVIFKKVNLIKYDILLIIMSLFRR